jgi:hypothetical protein
VSPSRKNDSKPQKKKITAEFAGQQSSPRVSRGRNQKDFTTRYAHTRQLNATWTPIALKARHIPAQGNALGIGRNESLALKGRDIIVRGIEERLYPALSGLNCSVYRHPGRCPGLVYVGLSGHRNMWKLLKLTRMRYAGDIRLRASLATARQAEARRKEEEHIFRENQPPGHPGD